MNKLLLVLLMVLFSESMYSQITVTHFNSEFNNPNKAEWVGDLKDCDIKYVDI